LESKKVHIVSFDIPSPPNYGGVIEVFHKIRSLNDSGVGVILHAYEYGDRKVSAELSRMCEEIHLYKRNMHWSKVMSTTPFIMSSRDHRDLIRNLEKDKYPVLLEGMHTGIHLGHPVLKHRTVLLRMHNIEWHYYRSLASAERSVKRKFYLHAEALKLKAKRHHLNKADGVLAISKREQQLLEREFDNIRYLPAFHPNDKLNCKEGSGDFVLYHGNLGVAENQKAAEWLVENVFDQLSIPLIIAGANPPSEWKKKMNGRHIKVIANPDSKTMHELVISAQMHVLPTFQDTGVKLKLLNALYNGRHVVVNEQMVAGNGLSVLCHVAEGATAMRDFVNDLWRTEFTADEKTRREAFLKTEFHNQTNAKRLIGWLYPHP